MNDLKRPGVGARMRARVQGLLSERLAPAQAASAVFVGVALGIIPIYGAQSIVALALATALRLNRPLTLAATFINNPVLQPFLVVGSLQLGHRTLHGHWVALTPSGFVAGGLKEQLGAFVVGSVLLAVLLATPCAVLTFAAFSWRAREGSGQRSSAGDSPRGSAQGLLARFHQQVRARYAAVPRRDRTFVRWKVRLDRIFDTLLGEDLGSGVAVDLGCGYGLALLAASMNEPGRPVFGCDLDERRIAAARQALSWPGCSLVVADAATAEIPRAGLVLIIDVLQYFDERTQADLLGRCCRALAPGGRLIFRVPESSRGWTTTLTAWLDGAIFRLGGAGRRPTHLPAGVYRAWLAQSGLSVSERHQRNRLPLSHVVFVATRAGGADA